MGAGLRKALPPVVVAVRMRKWGGVPLVITKRKGQSQVALFVEI